MKGLLNTFEVVGYGLESKDGISDYKIKLSGNVMLNDVLHDIECDDTQCGTIEIFSKTYGLETLKYEGCKITNYEQIKNSWVFLFTDAYIVRNMTGYGGKGNSNYRLEID